MVTAIDPGVHGIVLQAMKCILEAWTLGTRFRFETYTWAKLGPHLHDRTMVIQMQNLWESQILDTIFPQKCSITSICTLRIGLNETIDCEPCLLENISSSNQVGA